MPPDKRQSHGLFWCRQGNRANHKCIFSRIVSNTGSKVHNLRWKPKTDPCKTVILTNWERSTHYCVGSWEITRLCNCLVIASSFSQIASQFSWSSSLTHARSKPPARIEYWNLLTSRLWLWSCAHERNPQSIRLSFTTFYTRTTTIQVEYLHFLTTNAVHKAMTLEELKAATKQDKTLQHVSWLVRNQKWNQTDNLPTEYQDADQTELKVFRKVKDEQR